MIKKAELVKRSSVFCYGQIDHAMSQFLGHQLQQFVTDAHEDEETQLVTFHLNSQGGEPFAGKQIGQYLGDLMQIFQEGDSVVKPQIFVREYAISAAAVLLLYARSYGIPVYADFQTEVRFHDLKIESLQRMERTDLQRTLRVYNQEVENIVTLIREVAGLQLDSLEHEVVFKEDDLLEYRLIDDFVQ